MPKSNAELYEEAEAELYGRAFAESESEVFHDALALPEDDNDGDREFEEMESFDGEPLSLVEHAASSSQPPHPDPDERRQVCRRISGVQPSKRTGDRRQRHDLRG